MAALRATQPSPLFAWGHLAAFNHQCWPMRQIAGNGSCISQTWKVTPWGEFSSSEDGQKLMIYPMYSFDDVGALWLDVLGPDCLLQPSVQAHQIITNFSGRGSCISQTWKVTPWGEFLSSEDSQKLMIHPMYSSDNVAALWLDVWGPDRLLQKFGRLREWER